MGRSLRRRLISGLSVALVWAATASTVALPVTAAAAPLDLNASSFVLTWSAGFNQDQGAPIAESSPTVATLDGAGPAVVVGDRSGFLYALHLADGSAVAGWPVRAGGPIDSTPSVVPTAPDGPDDVYVGTGNAFEPGVGGYESIAANGDLRWSTQVPDPPQDTAPAYGVQASLAVGRVGGRTAVFAGTLGQMATALDAGNGTYPPGWPFFSADSVFSTAAVADLYGTGHDDFVFGGASTAGSAMGQDYSDGGHLRILSSTGTLICRADTDQEIDSSPAVGPILAGGLPGIVVGSGSFWSGASDTDTLTAYDPTCGQVWSDRLDGATSSSPALADVLGDGSLQVVEGTDTGSGGSVWVLNAASGAVEWHEAVTGEVIGSVVTADLTGSGYQDLLVPTTHGVDVIDGRTGATVTVLSQGGYQNAPLVTDDPDGTAGITIAGYNGANVGVVFHYEIPGSDGAAAVAAGSWPMFHHDPQLTGAVTSNPGRPPSPCQAPVAARPGYDLVASDGGVFSFGQPFCGSTGGLRLTSPVVGAAMAPPTGGYWLVASDGGVFAYGGARFYGSTGGIPLAEPVVGMAATADGRGYWLAASDGGVFAFGDARFLGSASADHLHSPVVAITATADGRGYWLVTSNGDVYNFGDARYLGAAGSTHLVAPIVGMAEDRDTGGYWLVGADGGVFSFDAPFYGSAGGLPLAKPVVGIAGTGDGHGYWLLGGDGGVFSYGDAFFHGSTGGMELVRPVVALVGWSG